MSLRLIAMRDILRSPDYSLSLGGGNLQAVQRIFVLPQSSIAVTDSVSVRIVAVAVAEGTAITPSVGTHPRRKRVHAVQPRQVVCALPETAKENSNCGYCCLARRTRRWRINREISRYIDKNDSARDLQENNCQQDKMHHTPCKVRSEIVAILLREAVPAVQPTPLSHPRLVDRRRYIFGVGRKKAYTCRAP